MKILDLANLKQLEYLYTINNNIFNTLDREI